MPASLCGTAGIILFLLSLPCFAHPVYVSACQIEHQPDSNRVHVTITMFTDDLEHALVKAGSERLYLGETDQSSAADSLILLYLKEKLAIIINKIQVEFDTLSGEIEINKVRTKYRMLLPGISSIGTIRVSNRIFFELFDTQKNLVYAKVNGEKKNLILTGETASGELLF